MGWGIFEKIFSRKRSSSQPTLGSKSNQQKGNVRPPTNNSTRNKNNSSLASATSAPDLASQILNRSTNKSTLSSKAPARPNPPSKSFGEVLNPEAVDTDDEVNTNFSPRSTLDKEKTNLNSSNQSGSNKFTNPSLNQSLTAKSGYISSESSTDSKGKSNTKGQNSIVFGNSSSSPANIFTARSHLSAESPRKASLTESIYEPSTSEPSQSNSDQPAPKSNQTIQNGSRDSNQTAQSYHHISATSTKKSIGNLSSLEIKDMQSFGQVSAVPSQGATGKGFINTTQSGSVRFREPESNVFGPSSTSESTEPKPRSLSVPNRKSTNNSAPSNLNLTKEDVKISSNLEKQNKELRDRLDKLENELHTKNTNDKRQIDLLMAKFYDGIMNSNEKEQLKKLFISKQQTSNEKIMNEQAHIIESLKYKNKQLRADKEQLKLSNRDENKTRIRSSSGDASFDITELKEELDNFKSLVYRMNLSAEEKDQKILIMQNKIDHNEKSQIEIEKIRMQAQVVLEENAILREQNELREARIIEIEKTHIKEVGRLSKRIIISESEKVNVQNRLELFTENHNEILKKYNETSVELNRRITLEEHLKITGDLKQKIEEISLKNRQELEKKILIIEDTSNQKNALLTKMTSVQTENKRLAAENEVLEKALEEGIGRKIQRKIQELERKLQIAVKGEKSAQQSLQKLVHEIDKMKLERKSFASLSKSTKLEAKKTGEEKDMEISRLEEKFEEFKERAAVTLAKTMKKKLSQDEKFSLFKIENEKKLSEIANVLEKKQEQLDGFLKEKKAFESQLDNYCEITISENNKLKDVLS